MTAPASVHKARLKITGSVYESRCGHAIDEPFATDDWTRVSCLKCLRSGAKHSEVVAKLREEVRAEKLRRRELGYAKPSSHRGNWSGVG